MIKVSSNSMRRTGQNDGFTLIELMVSLAAGAMVIGSMFMLGAGTARHFQDQSRVAQTQTGLRFAMEQIRRDIARAGYWGTPNSRRERTCMAGPFQVQAVEFANDVSGDVALIDNASENRVSTDRLTLVGNYATDDAYMIVGLSSSSGSQTNADTVMLQTQWQGFRRSFVDLSGNPVPASFTEAFRAGRMIHLQTLQGMHFFRRITASSLTGNAAAMTATVTFADPVPVGGACIVGLADGATVAPLSRIRYRVANLGWFNTTGNTYITGNSTQLIREEITFEDNPSVIAGTTRIIAEYVVDFNLDFLVDTQLAAGAAPTLVWQSGATVAGTNLLGSVNTSTTPAPNRLRSIQASLSVRTPEQDKRLSFTQRTGPIGSGAPLTSYRFNQNLRGAARVRTVFAEVFLPNIASRGLRP